MTVASLETYRIRKKEYSSCISVLILGYLVTANKTDNAIKNNVGEKNFKELFPPVSDIRWNRSIFFKIGKLHVSCLRCTTRLLRLEVQ